jgi:hypothetical protein
MLEFRAILQGLNLQKIAQLRKLYLKLGTDG